MTARAECSIEGCGRRVRSWSWCDAHYTRWLKHGDPLAGPTPKGAAQRYFREVVLTYDGDDCLTWPFSKTRMGYATGSIGGGGSVARAVCKEAHGEPPTPKHQAAHSCGHGHLACVTKRHLSWKTPTENQADRIAHGTEYRGEQHHKARLTEADVLAIKAMNGTSSQRAIALEFGVSQYNVWMIIHGKIWKHLHHEGSV